MGIFLAVLALFCGFAPSVHTAGRKWGQDLSFRFEAEALHLFLLVWLCGRGHHVPFISGPSSGLDNLDFSCRLYMHASTKAVSNSAWHLSNGVLDVIRMHWFAPIPRNAREHPLAVHAMKPKNDIPDEPLTWPLAQSALPG